ncbi:MAG: iron-sulfur cluster assembly accessory protein [Rhodospirillales bacterium]|nr:iron-sulfur cluster assembly accessory protein [Rhodospirillales bacterium]
MNKLTKSEAAIKLTDAAVARVKSLIDRTDKPVLGVRVGVTNTGCSGHMYQVEFAEDLRPMEDVVEQDGVKVFIDPLALMFIFGSTMDYTESKLQSGFVFTNPNVKGQCGCGESFSV